MTLAALNDTDPQGDFDSDAVYEKRHRKYENFEKRIRMREKEKLKHEQYKLKERLEQIRGMDPQAFLALPASAFTPVPTESAASGGEEDEEVAIYASVPGAPRAGSWGSFLVWACPSAASL